MTGKRPRLDLSLFNEAKHDAREAALRFRGLAALPADHLAALERLHTNPLKVSFAALAAWRSAGLADAGERDLRAQAVSEARQTATSLRKAMKAIEPLEKQHLGAHRRASLAAFRAGKPVLPVDLSPAREALNVALERAHAEVHALGGRGRPASLLHHFALALLPIWQEGGLPSAGEPVKAFADFITAAAVVSVGEKPGEALALGIAREIAPRGK